MKLRFFVVAVALVWVGCSSDESRCNLEVRLTDAPGDYEEVNIDIQDVQIHRAEGTQTSGWVSLNVAPGVINVLTLTNGLDKILGSASLPSGRISQIRLVLGSNNTIRVGGLLHPLKTPSAKQSGLKIKLSTQMTPGGSYLITLDFDAARSIQEDGSGGYVLRPVLRALINTVDGDIGGNVTPVEALPAVFVLSGADTVATAYADSLGLFLIRAIPAGTYTVTFDSKGAFATKVVEDVTVTTGNTTNMGEVLIN